MEVEGWWELQYDSLWLFSDGFVREDDQRGTYAWTVYARIGDERRELCWGGGERVGVARYFLHSYGIVWPAGRLMVDIVPQGVEWGVTGESGQLGG